MGRIKTQLIKRTTAELMKEHGDEFGTEFSDNKKHVDRFAKVGSKKIRNIIAGYVTRVKKNTKDI